MKNKMLQKVEYFIAAILILLTAYLFYEYTTFVKQRNHLVEEKGIETTAALRDQVDDILSRITTEGNRLAESFGRNNYTTEQIENMIKESSLSIPEIQGVTACFEPFAFSEKQRLYCPYYNKGTQDYLFVGKSYDYSNSNLSGTDWYTSVRDNGAKWVEPYFAQGAQDWYVDYGIPFYYKDGPNKGKVRGTITMSFVCGGFKNLVHDMSIGKTGYGMITSNEGTFLVHPTNEYIGTVNIYEMKNKTSQTELVHAYTKMGNRATGHVSFIDKESNDEKLFFYDKIPSSGWGLGLMFFKQDLLKDQVELNHRYIHLAIVISLLFLCLLAINYNKDYLDEGEIWRLSFVGSCLLIGNIFLIGYLQHTTNYNTSSKKSSPITDMTALSNFIAKQHSRAEELKIEKSIPVPTGIFIQRLEFDDSYNINFGGKIWQKYPLNIVDKVNIGFSLPQMSPFAEASYIEENYRQIVEAKEGEKSYLLVGWEIRVTLRLNLSYRDFPFDKRHLNIEIVPLNNTDHLVFTPDLGSYNFTNPSKKSGLHPDIELPGSEIIESYFNYSFETFDSDFGYGVKGLFEEVPVLHYNIKLRRILLNSFVTYLIPIFVTLIMVFILIYACGKTDERQGIIESMAAFFFVLIFSHIDLRKEIVTADLIYMEYFYFIAYFMLIFSTYNLITYSKNKSIIFDFNDNQIFKAAFFPLYFFLILIVTLTKFY
ncbi:MAG: cache domain-containing protein [Saprospiraceae bacterium]